IRLVLLIPAFIWFGVSWQSGMLLAPFVMICLVLLGSALGMFLMPIDSLYKDVGRFITMATPFWMILTPIIYVPLNTWPGNLLNWVNPAAPLLIFARDLLLVGTASEHMMIGLIFAALSVPLFLIAVIYYRVSLPVLIERMAA
ncbi:MAG: ABC transporter permease, partial [Planctomycetota bacterium]